MNLTDLDTFVRVAELGTISAAANAMGVPKSTVSRRISRLETSLGVSLLQRVGRGYTLTERGRLVLERCGPALREIAGVERALGDLDTDPSGLLRVTVPYDVGTTSGFATLVTAFRESYPGVDLEVVLTNRMVDVIEEGYDVAIRPTLSADSPGLLTRGAGSTQIGWYASDAYLARRGVPKAEADLIDHHCVVHTVMRQPDLFASAKISGATVCSDFGLVLNLTIAGAGLGAVPSFVARGALESGRIVPVLPELRSDLIKFWLTWPETRGASPRVRAFIDFASQALVEHVF